MAILSLIVYGSRAREDHSDSSDTDLFAITDDEKYEMIVKGSTNIACYPLKQAITRARSGDLFFLHITQEAREIYDPQNFFERIKKDFVRKESYITEISNACELGYALVASAGRIQDYYLLNKRLAWCLRTILIARSAEMGCPTFSKEGLAQLFEDRRISKLISMKDSDNYDSKAYPDFHSIFVRHGIEQNKEMPTEYEDLINYFLQRNNAMGLKTARLLSHDTEPESYEWG
ncbi:nucleotidyltransferase domain-containing protein [Pseudomonas sp. NPDC087804]|uniref:anti-phage Hailong system nucleotidyltransferase HalB n=1 Tax=Pseudomonas sp. NPDC087804 TaxID=3364449 RepID=UPI003800BED7